MTSDSSASPLSRPYPGDLSKDEKVHRMIRVDQAGEYGAIQIYKGQLAILKNTPEAPKISHMLEQEETHLTAFNEQLLKNRVRPTALSPLWKGLGFGLGAITALMGKKPAMLCTVAVEEVIDEHYASQEHALETDSNTPEEQILKELISKCRQEELEHRDTGLEEGARDFPGHQLLEAAIKTGVKAAIWLSKRV